MNYIAVLCIFGAIIVAVNGHDGWGWFLLLALLLS